MDFLHPKKKKKNQIRLFVGYFLMGLALIISTVIIVFFTQGFDYDTSTGQIITKGLFIIDSHPVGSDIYINGIKRGGTDARFVLPTGPYDVKLQREGFRTWSHSYNLEPSSIEQIVYPFIFPTNLSTKQLASFKAPSFTSQSPDRRWVVFATDKIGSFSVIDLNSKDNPATTISLPSDSFTSVGSSHVFKDIEWSTDNENLLLKHTWDGGQEFIVLNRDNPTQSFNVSKLFPSQQPTKVVLRDKKADRFYFYNSTSSTIVTASRGDLSISPVLKHVGEFKQYKDDTILYVNPEVTAAGTFEVRMWKNGQDYKIRELPASPLYLLELADFGGHLYVVAGSSSDGRVYIYRDPLNAFSRSKPTVPKPTRVLVVINPQFVSFSQNTRFIAVQGGSNFAIYDAETIRQYRYDTKLNIANQKATWMDGHRLTAVDNGKATVFDFDNTNKQTLAKADPSFGTLFNRDYDAFFNIAPTSDQAFGIFRTELKIK